MAAARVTHTPTFTSRGSLEADAWKYDYSCIHPVKKVTESDDQEKLIIILNVLYENKKITFGKKNFLLPPIIFIFKPASRKIR